MKRSEIFYQIVNLLASLPEYDIEFEKRMIKSPVPLHQLMNSFHDMAECAEKIEDIQEAEQKYLQFIQENCKE